MSLEGGENPVAGQPAESKRLEVDRLAGLIRQICITRSNLSLYSFEHSVSQKNLKETWRILTRILEERESIGLDISKNTLLFEGLPIEERNPMVEKISRDMRNLHVNGVTFHRGLTLKELAIFFKLLTLKREVLDEHGGARQLLQEAQVEKIGVNQTRYVRLDEDKKIVSKDARVVDGQILGEKAADKELIRQLWEALMKKQVDREWLLDEIRADPAKVADQIVGLLKYYDNREVLEDQQEKQQAMETMLNSIKTLGLRLAERDAGEAETDESQQTVAQSMLVLERELKARSAGLKSSKAVTRFIEEITSNITAFVDTQQADQIAKEYLKDEEGLKRTEQLLRKVLKREPQEQLMPRLRSLLESKGLTEKDFEKLLDRMAPKTEKTERKKRTVRRRVPRPVQEKIEKALVNKIETMEDKQETVSYLSGLFQREVQEKLKNINEEKVQLAAALERVDEMLSAAGLGLVVLDETGRPIMATRKAKAILGDSLGEELDPALLELLTSGDAISPASREVFLSRKPDDQKERLNRFLNALDHPIPGKDGKLLGLIFKGG